MLHAIALGMLMSTFFMPMWLYHKSTQTVVFPSGGTFNYDVELKVGLTKYIAQTGNGESTVKFSDKSCQDDKWCKDHKVRSDVTLAFLAMAVAAVAVATGGANAAAFGGIGIGAMVAAVADLVAVVFCIVAMLNYSMIKRERESGKYDFSTSFFIAWVGTVLLIVAAVLSVLGITSWKGKGSSVSPNHDSENKRQDEASDDSESS
ncbi:uncharacterized protein AMSG_08161 [Thecamonas trahens ATCC 50062]|uniref:Uncharacterized protein n=1 Tax=Thecamonas trahens ATCC 50062 TaxID=461836 RepID=A0A0L0DHY8_THETB|nr:hypothetical protein AMSG_08161 [Thecamonas trahens ATCC 50062]KNC51922.1 hypothetical protein AMSG_08161 [Thecamonas trahens ATCC 50062]|eukprot:XP_013755518.1 hypothetical protein AMSG_08161 [Thecamonas trahens ATCC 50062]